MLESLNLDLQRFSFQIGGKKIMVYTFGSGPRKVLLIPPFGTAGAFYGWWLYGHDISGFTFVTFDFPGWSGASDKYKKGENFKMEDYLTIVQNVADLMQFDTYSVLGYSFGAALAVRYIATNLNKIHKVVIVSPVVDGRAIRGSLLKISCLLADKLHLGIIIKLVMQVLFRLYINQARSKGVLPVEIFEEAGKLIPGLQSKILAQSAGGLFRIDWKEYLNQGRNVKTFVICSKDENVVFQQQAEFVRKYAAHDKSAFFKGRHEAFILNPDKQLTEEVLEFLR